VRELLGATRKEYSHLPRYLCPLRVHATLWPRIELYGDVRNKPAFPGMPANFYLFVFAETLNMPVYNLLVLLRFPVPIPIVSKMLIVKKTCELYICFDACILNFCLEDTSVSKNAKMLCTCRSNS
jgi:hypothetical protein